MNSNLLVNGEICEEKNRFENYYVLLTESEMLFYKSESSIRVSAKINLKTNKIILQDNIKNIDIDKENKLIDKKNIIKNNEDFLNKNDENKNINDIFLLIIPETEEKNHIFYFKCENEDEKYKWTSYLRKIYVEHNTKLLISNNSGKI
jgi:hypothetical protein